MTTTLVENAERTPMRVDNDFTKNLWFFVSILLSVVGLTVLAAVVVI